MIKKIILLILMVFIIIFPSFPSVFDAVNWEYEKTYRSVNLFVQKNQDNNLNYYKAETVIEGFNFDELVHNITSFNAYDKIFARTNFFKVIKKIDENTYIVNADLNFSPYKNRNYYIECISKKAKTKTDKNKFVIEWSPIDKVKYANLIEPCENEKRINYNFGRWSIIELDKGKLYVSVEYHNDWETNLPLLFVYGAEKSTIFNNIFSFLSYSKKAK